MTCINLQYFSGVGRRHLPVCFFPSSASTPVTRIRFLNRPFGRCFIHICNAQRCVEVAVAEGIGNVYIWRQPGEGRGLRRSGWWGKWGVIHGICLRGLGRRHGTSLQAIPGVWTMGLFEPIGSFAQAQVPTRIDESVYEIELSNNLHTRLMPNLALVCGLITSPRRPFVVPMSLHAGIFYGHTDRQVDGTGSSYITCPAERFYFYVYWITKPI